MYRRQRLSWVQKSVIYDECLRRETTISVVELVEIAVWAKRKLKKFYQSSWITIYRILKNGESMKAFVSSPSKNQKQKLVVTSTTLKNCTSYWVWDKYYRRVYVTECIICETSKALRDYLNSILPVEKKVDLKLSIGWLRRFKARNNFGSHICHWEADDLDPTVIERQLPLLRYRLSHYNVANIFNCDEFGIYYQQAPKWSIVPAPFTGRKNKNQRATVLACRNGNGMDRMPPLVIGKSANPRYFIRLDLRASGIMYRASAKAWIFFWVARVLRCLYWTIIREEGFLTGRKSLMSWTSRQSSYITGYWSTVLVQARGRALA